MNITGDAKTIAQAYVKARSEMSATVIKDAKGNYGKYATLAAIVEATTAAFIKNGLAIVQEVGTNEQGVMIDTWLIHESGATMQLGSLTMPCDRKPQSVGSALTYGRRYALAAVCGLAPDDDDDDGELAQASARRLVTPRRVDSTTGEIVAQERPQPPQDEEFQNARERIRVADQRAEAEHETPPHNRMWGIGQSVFGSDWDMARPWLLKKWTAKVTPDNIRSSASDLTDDEKTLLGDYLNESATALQKVWAKQKAQMAAQQAQPQEA